MSDTGGFQEANLTDTAGKTEKIIFIIERFLRAVGLLAIGVAMFLTTVDVVLRYVFASPVPGGFYLSQFLLVAMVALPLAYCQEIKAHIRVDFLLTRIPKKAGVAIDVCTMILALALFSFATYTGAIEARRAFLTGDYVGSVVVDYPLWPAKSLLPIGTGCLCLRLLIDVARGVQNLRGRLT